MSSPEATLIGVLADTTGPHRTRTALAGQEGLEPPTTGFGDRDSSQLSYCPLLITRGLLTSEPTAGGPSGFPPRSRAGAQPSPGGPPPVDEVYVAGGPPSNHLAGPGESACPGRRGRSR